MTKRISPPHKREIVEAYLAGASAKEAAARFGYSAMTCRAALRARGIPARTMSQAKRKYAVDEDFFNGIDTEEKAYWLGFITADGSISSSHNSIGITLQSRDVNPLRKFAASLHSGHPIHDMYNRGRSHVRIFITSRKFTHAVKLLGLMPNKVFTVKPCAQIPESLIRHYWRGVFDGDGSIYVMRDRKPDYPAWQLKLVGNKAIVEGFISFCQQHVHSRAGIRPQKNSFNVKFTGSAMVRKLLQVLYAQATVYLDRKKELADQIIASGASTS